MHLRELDANLLVVLEALLAETSVTKAADRLGRSPSAISHALANLRHVFGDELFVRAGQKLVPTARALEIAPEVTAVVAGMARLLAPERPFAPMELKRDFAVAANEVCELTLLHGLREALRTEAPGVGIGWQNLRVSRIAADLRANNALLAIAETPHADDSSGDIGWQHLFDDRCVTLARPGHPLSGRQLTPAQFAAAEHVLIASDEERVGLLEARLGEQGLKLNVGMRASSIFAGLFLALDSYYFVTVPGSVARAIRKRVPFSIVRQPFAPLTRRNFLVWHRSHDNDAAHRWLRERMVSYVHTAIAD